MSLDNEDPEITAAFSSPAASSQGNDISDPEIASAFDNTDHSWSGAAKGVWKLFLGGAEGAAHAITSGVGALGGGLGYLYGLDRSGGDPEAGKAVQEAIQSAATYQPKTEEGKASVRAFQGPFNPLNWPDKAGQVLGDKAADMGAPPGVSTALRVAPDAAAAALGMRKAFSEPSEAPKPAPRMEPTLGDENTAPVNPEAQAAVEKSYAGQSMGAAANAPDLSGASPRLQQAIADNARKNGGIVNPTALENHLEADKFGVALMDGQASRDPVQFSKEQNSTDPQIVDRINKQNGQLVDALDEVRRDAAPSHVSNSPRENGQVVVDDLKAYDEPIKADISAKYDAANKAAEGGQLQMDGGSFVERANAALKPQGKARFLPSQVKGILDDVDKAGGQMSLDDFQGYSTQLAAEVRKAQRAGDGNAVTAISKVRDALEATQPAGETSAAAKALYDQARVAAKARFDALRADPAYAAAVDEASGPGAVKKGTPSPLADTFLDDYALSRGAPKSQLDMMVGKLSDEGKGALASHTLSAIRKQAVGSTGNVSPAGFNTGLSKYSDKIGSLVDSETADKLDSLGRVIANAKSAPPGNFVNYSKSGVISNAALGIGESALNAKTFGMGVPILKQVIKNNFARDTLAPGAGLRRLSDLMNTGPNP